MEIKISNITYTISDNKILDNINTTIKEGTINGVIGPTGSGKTSLFQILNGMIKPNEGFMNAGDLLIDDDLSESDIDKVHFNIGYVYQYPEEQLFCKTVEKEISYGLDFFNYKKENKDKRIKDALKMVGLGESYLKKDPFKLSSGEMCSVALASVLAINPEIIILDEPTIGLDVKSKKNLVKIIRTIKRRYKKTIIIISQDIEFIHQICDYVYLINKRKIIIEGDKYTVFKEQKLLKENGILVPKIIEFENFVLNNKNIKLGYRDDVNDLIKDILRNK